MYAYVITIEWQAGPGISCKRTQNGTFTPPAGVETRNDAFEYLYKHVAKATGHPTPSVLFFSLEPNKLPA